MDKDAAGQGQKAATSTWAETKPVDPSKNVQSRAELIAAEEQVGAGGGVTGSLVGLTGSGKFRSSRRANRADHDTESSRQVSLHTRTTCCCILAGFFFQCNFQGLKTPFPLEQKAKRGPAFTDQPNINLGLVCGQTCGRSAAWRCWLVEA